MDAVSSVLQFGAIVPPLSPWRDVERIVPRPASWSAGPSERQFAAAPGLQHQADHVVAVLDETLLRLIGDDDEPVLQFSGGVDSGLLAARLVHLGRRPRLFNYAFRKDDPESLLAEKMAQHLGLQMERLLPGEALTRALDDPGELYPQPFGDHSVVPTSDLARQLNGRLDGSRVIIQGTGADGLFGLTQKIASWRRVYQLPAPLRRAAALALRKHLSGGRLEPYARVMARSAHLPLSAALTAQNPFAGDVYRTCPKVWTALSDWIGDGAGLDSDSSVVLTDLALTCANVFAQKDLPIYESAGHTVALPFLDRTFVEALVHEAPYWETSEAKAPLKAALARHVPGEMVYRPKVGFVERRPKVFDQKQFQSYLREAGKGPLSPLLNPSRLDVLCSALERGGEMPPQTLNFLWSLTFTDRWYKTAGVRLA